MQNYSTLNQLFNVFRTSLIKLDHTIILIEINVKCSIHAAQNTIWVIFFPSNQTAPNWSENKTKNRQETQPTTQQWGKDFRYSEFNIKLPLLMFIDCHFLN